MATRLKDLRSRLMENGNGVAEDEAVEDIQEPETEAFRTELIESDEKEGMAEIVQEITISAIQGKQRGERGASARAVMDAAPADAGSGDSEEEDAAYEKPGDDVIDGEVFETAHVSLDKIVAEEKDLDPKYSDVEKAVESIMKDGAYYEDYTRGAKAGLVNDKNFVLAVLAQDFSRFYAPETPKPHEWMDEEYLTARLSWFFMENRESIKQDAIAEVAENLYNFLRKHAYSEEAYALIIALARKVSKAYSARAVSKEESDRIMEGIRRFNSALNGAFAIAKEKRIAQERYEAVKAAELRSGKAALFSLSDEIEFTV